MKKILLKLALLGATLFAYNAANAQTVAVTADLKTMFNAAAATKTQVCFSLTDGNGNQLSNPRTSSGVLVPTATQCVLPDGSGHISTTVIANDQITPANSIYSVTYTFNGRVVHGDIFQFALADGTENLNTKTSLSTVPVVSAPTGDATYLRLDGGNIPTNNISFGAFGLSLGRRARDCRQDGPLDPTNVADAAAVLNLCFLNAFINGQEAYVPSGFYNISSANVNLANAFGVRVHGESSIVAFSGTNPVWGTVFMCNRGVTTTCVEMEGSQYAEFDHITIVQNGCIGSKCVVTPTGIGLVWGRDNSLTGLGGSTASGTGVSNNFCFQTGANLHDVTIANLGAANNTLNGSRGYVNFYNVGGTENAGMSNVTMYGGTQTVLADSDVITPTGTYYPLSTGCPSSMTEFSFKDTNFLTDNGQLSQLPNIESDNASSIFIWNGEFIGGNAAVLGKGTSSFNNWVIVGAQENTATPSYFINLGTNAVAPKDFFVHAITGVNTAMVNATSNNPSFVGDVFEWGSADQTHPPFTNTATGQVFQGGALRTGATSISLSNMQMLGSDVYTPNAGRANVAFSSGSGYVLHGNDGITTFGPHFASIIRQAFATTSLSINDFNNVAHFFISGTAPYTNTFISGTGTGKVFLGANSHISAGDTGSFIIGDGIGGTGKTIQQEASVTTGSIGATTRSEVLLTWGTTMGDTNYKVQCNVQDSTTAAGTQGLTFERIRTLSATQIGAVVNNPTAGALTGTIYCTGTHP